MVETLRYYNVKNHDFKLNLENNPIDFDTTNYFETIQWKNVIIDCTKGQYSVLEMSQKDSLLKVEEDPGLNLREDKTELRSEKNEWKTKYETKDNLLQKMIEELVIEKGKVSEFTQKLAVHNHDAQNISSFSIIEHAEVFNIGEGTFENQNDL